MSFLTRIKFHTYRYRGEIIYSASIIASLMIMIGLAFPKDNTAIAEYVGLLTDAGLDALFASVDVDAPGWLFWVSLMGSAYTYFVSVIAAIKIGAKLYPTQDNGALELIASSPKQPRRFYLENALAAVLAILLIFLPAFLILALYSVTQDAVSTIPRLGIMFLLNSLVALFFVALSSLPSIFRFSQGTGTKLGYLYLISAFLIEFTAGSIEEYSEYAKISVNTYVSPSAGLLTGEHNWQEAGILLGLSIVLFAISYFLVRRPDYVEKVGVPKKYNLRFFPQFSSQGKLAQKYPILFDQFRKDRSYFIIWTLVVNFALVYIALIFNVALKDDPAVMANITSSFGGIMDAFTFGYTAPATYAGFLTFEVFGLLWLYFGLFVFIPAINIANRDQANDEQDLIWSNSITPRQVINNRTLSVVLYFSVYYWFSYLTLIGTAMLLDLELDAFVVLKVFGIGFIYHVGLIFLFVGITMGFPIRKGKKYTMWFYIISIFGLISSFLEPSLEFLKYGSIVYYFDAVGILLDKVELINQILSVSIVFLLSVGIYWLTLNYRYRKMDLLS